MDSPDDFKIKGMAKMAKATTTSRDKQQAAAALSPGNKTQGKAPAQSTSKGKAEVTTTASDEQHATMAMPPIIVNQANATTQSTGKGKGKAMTASDEQHATMVTPSIIVNQANATTQSIGKGKGKAMTASDEQYATMATSPTNEDYTDDNYESQAGTAPAPFSVINKNRMGSITTQELQAKAASGFQPILTDADLEEGEIGQGPYQSWDLKYELAEQEQPGSNWTRMINNENLPPYYYHAPSQTSTWEEPKEPYWIYDFAKNRYGTKPQKPSLYFRYIPCIHGDFDKNASYAPWVLGRGTTASNATLPTPFQGEVNPAAIPGHVPGPAYDSSGTFNRATGAYQSPQVGPERHSDAAKSGRQMHAFFDMDAAANANDGRSLKAERRERKLTREEIQGYRVKKHQKQVAKLRAHWS